MLILLKYSRHQPKQPWHGSIRTDSGRNVNSPANLVFHKINSEISRVVFAWKMNKTANRDPALLVVEIYPFSSQFDRINENWEVKLTILSLITSVKL